MRYGYEFWRVIVSFFFHSNIAHFVLNVIGLQIYGYFVEWYYGKVKYAIALVLAGILSYFLSCVAMPTSVSTTSSALLFVIMALKIYFLYEYKDYKPLLPRRLLIYLLYLLILGINIIPIVVNNNVDFTNHIGGFLTGLLLGLFYHINKMYN
jgi:membrane associated rhomboid family serine protease